MKERIEYIDLAKGICILLVVLDHIAGYRYFSDGNYPMNDIFEQTRMPLYFILSGLFFKDYGGIREFLLRKTNRILVPYLFFLILYRVSAKAIYSFTGISVGEIWAPLWFLLCLFWMNAIFATMYYSVKRFVQTERTSEIILALCVLGFGIAGYLIGYTPLSIGSAMTSLPFLWMGYFLNRKLSFFQLSIRWQWALLAGIGLLAVLHFTFVGDNFFYLNTYSTPLSLIYLAGLLGHARHIAAEPHHQMAAHRFLCRTLLHHCALHAYGSREGGHKPPAHLLGRVVSGDGHRSESHRPFAHDNGLRFLLLDSEQVPALVHCPERFVLKTVCGHFLNEC